MKINQQISVLILALITLWAGLVPPISRAQDPGRPPLVLAFYYNWFDEKTWTPDKVSDMPQKPYVSRDRATMARQVEEAKGAGIDALVVSWYGPTGDTNQTEPNFATLLEVAQERGFKVAIDFETASPFMNGPNEIVTALQHLLSVHATKDAYLKVDGKPVVFFWAIQRVPVGPGQSSLDAWRSIRQQADPEHRAVWIAEGVDINYQDVFDGHHLYSIAWSKNVSRTLADWSSRVRKWSSSHGSNRLWVATVMPGYNDLRTGRPDAFVREREGGAFYEEVWRAALASQPDWVIITSFNEWVEGSQIEPSQSYGNRYLDLTREWAKRFKTGAPVPPPDTPQASPSLPAATAPAVTLPTTVMTSTVSIQPTASPTVTVSVRSTAIVTATAPVALAANLTATVTMKPAASLPSTVSPQPATSLTATVLAKPTVGPTATASVEPTMVPQPGKVLKDKLQVRAGPGQDFAVVTTLSKGDIVQVLSQTSPEGWIKVAGPSSETGFVPSESVEQKATPLPTGTLTPVPVQPAMATTAALTSTDAGQPSAPATPEVMQVSVTPKAVQPAEAMVTENGIKLREGPGTSFGIVAKLKANDPITVTGVNEDDQWFLVRLSDNTEGWLAVRYVQLKPTPTVTSSPPTTTATVLPTATVVLAMLPVTSTIPLLTPEITPSPPTSLTLSSFPPAEGAETTVPPLPTVSPARVQGLAGAILILLGVGALGVAIVFGAMSIWARRG